CRELVPRGGEALRATKALVDTVVTDAVRGADHIVDVPSGKRRVQIRSYVRLREREPATDRAALPHPHQPDDVVAGLGDAVPAPLGDGSEADVVSLAVGQVGEPYCGVDLVDQRMARNGHAELPTLAGLQADGSSLRG